MRIAKRDEDGVVYVNLEGELDSDALPDLETEVDALLDSGKTRICLNVGRLAFVTSTALSFLVNAQRRLRAQGGEMVFSAPSRFFQSTVRTLELHHIFEILADDEAARSHFAGGPGAAPA